MAKLFTTGLAQHYEQRSYKPIDKGNYEGVVSEVSLYAKEPVLDEEGAILNPTAIKGKIDITSGKTQEDGSDVEGRKITFFFNLATDGMEKGKHDFFAQRLQSLVLSAKIPFDENGFDPDSLVDKSVKFAVDFKRDKNKKIIVNDDGLKETEIRMFLFDEQPATGGAPAQKSAANPGSDFDFS